MVMVSINCRSEDGPGYHIGEFGYGKLTSQHELGD